MSNNKMNRFHGLTYDETLLVSYQSSKSKNLIIRLRFPRGNSITEISKNRYGEVYV